MRKVRIPTRSPGRPPHRTATGPRSKPYLTRRTGPGNPVGLYDVEQVLGTTVSVDLADALPVEDLVWLCEEVFGWLHRVERLFSTFRPASDVSRLRRGDQPHYGYAPEVHSVLDRCAALYLETNGYFDPYVTGALDPSGYVKGWAIQQASDRLASAGCHNHCLTAGGDVRARGFTPGDEPWRITIRDPRDPHQAAWVVTGTDLAVATSGHFERGPQVIDPYRGCPATQLRSVTVVGQDLGTADAYSTAGLAMGHAALTWLAGIANHESAVMTDDGRRFQSNGLAITPA